MHEQKIIEESRAESRSILFRETKLIILDSRDTTWIMNDRGKLGIGQKTQEKQNIKGGSGISVAPEVFDLLPINTNSITVQVPFTQRDQDVLDLRK